MKNKIRPIDANALAQKIREYMSDFPNATALLTACQVILSMLGDENQTPTLAGFVPDYNVEPPARIDRERWEPCELCRRKGEQDPCYENQCFRKNAHQCNYSCDKFLRWREVDIRLRNSKFCPRCGRPLTPEAWEELERRLNA